MPINEVRERPESWNSSKIQGHGRIDEKRLEKACQEFESILIHQMMKTMRQTIPRTGFMAEGKERNIFQALFDEEISKNISKSGGLGLGKMLLRQMKKKAGENGSFEMKKADISRDPLRKGGVEE